MSSLYSRTIAQVLFATVLSLFVAACASAAPTATPTVPLQPDLNPVSTVDTPSDTAGGVEFTLETAIADGRLVFIGAGGEIDGKINPTLRVPEDSSVTVILVNGDGAEHDVAFPDLDATTSRITGKGSTTSVTFTAGQVGEFVYFCTVPGHRAAGMEGTIVIGEPIPNEVSDAADIVRSPIDLPGPIGDRGPTTVDLDITAVQVEGTLADGVTYTYWTFDGKVPGPFLRVGVGDTINLSLKNELESTHIHSIDLHAVTGPGGGAAVMQIPPGETGSFTFKALQPGLYVYHCATPSVPTHIANGMYGLILVEPDGGLSPVDREFYVMQGEMYTEQPFGEKGHADFSYEKMLNETPEYFVFNGAAGALASDENALRAEVGDTVRIYFGVGGPNAISSFHVIGEIFDRVYDEGSLTSEPLTDVQTTLVPPGGATVVEFVLEVPGRYILVDHALARLERGLVGLLYAEGEDNPDVFRKEATP